MKFNKNTPLVLYHSALFKIILIDISNLTLHTGVLFASSSAIIDK